MTPNDPLPFVTLDLDPRFKSWSLPTAESAAMCVAATK